jgi:hypothetical protein
LPAIYSITTRADGTILTAAIYNADHQNHVNNGDASQLGGYSVTVGQMQTTADPGQVGSESLATVIADELQRVRFKLAAMQGQTQWYPNAITALDAAAWGVFN